MTKYSSDTKRWLAVGGGVVIIGIAWLTASVFSESDLGGCLLLFFTQVMLAFLALHILLFGQTPNGAGPGVIHIMGLHVLLYYGVSNLVPALLPSLRPEDIAVAVTYRIPPSSVYYYAQATLAALLFLLGFYFGNGIFTGIYQLLFNRAAALSQRCAWLPNYRISLASTLFCCSLLAIGTVSYGLKFTNTLTDQNIASFSLPEQLLFHGLFWFMPVAPFFAASAYIQARTPRQRVHCRWLLATVTLIAVGSLLAWRMRSTAMIATVLPLALLMYGGRLKGLRAGVLMGVIAVLVYIGVTSVRINLEKALTTNSDRSLSASELLTAVIKSADAESILGRALSDISYRTAGLEGVAAILQYQNLGEVDLQMGRVITAGFEQALPRSMRTVSENPMQVKIAPSYLGIFQPGDWVTTFLSEFTLDFGAVWLFFPAILTGFFLSCLDAVWLRASQVSALRGLLVLRIAFLLYPLATGSSFANMTLLFFKATVGYTFALLLISVSLRRGRKRRTPKNVLVLPKDILAV